MKMIRQKNHLCSLLLLYLSSFRWICSGMGVSLEWISSSNSNPIQMTNSARAFNRTKRAWVVNVTDWALAANRGN